MNKNWNKTEQTLPTFSEDLLFVIDNQVLAGNYDSEFFISRTKSFDADKVERAIWSESEGYVYYYDVQNVNFWMKFPSVNL
jgi:hypothetical protein